jgi:glycosyltransferase involved in cell wall biosynthesis
MRVLLATNSRDRGSTSRTLEGWTRLLPAAGVHCTVTVGGPGPLFTALTNAGIRTEVRPLRVLPNKRWPFPFLRASLRLSGVARSSASQLIHVNEHDHHLVAASAARLARVPVLTHLRFRPEAQYAAWLFKRRRQPARLFFTSRTQMLDSAESLRAVVPESRWRVLPNGLDFSTFGLDASARQPLRAAWGVDDDTVVLGVACAISPRKRVDHLVRVVSRLRAAGIDAVGVVAGEPHFPEDEAVVRDIRQLARDLGILEFMRFLGYIEPAEPLYHAWDICVGTSSYETFGMTMLEAMGCSCPVVSYPSGSVVEIVGSAARIVPDGDEDGLFSECFALAVDRTRRRELGLAGREHAAATYDVRRIVPLLAAEYRDVVSGTGW